MPGKVYLDCESEGSSDLSLPEETNVEVTESVSETTETSDDDEEPDGHFRYTWGWDEFECSKYRKQLARLIF